MPTLVPTDQFLENIFVLIREESRRVPLPILIHLVLWACVQWPFLNLTDDISGDLINGEGNVHWKSRQSLCLMKFVDCQENVCVAGESQFKSVGAVWF